NAGHILGAAAVEVRVGGKTLLFSGDIGPDEHRFHEDPSGPQGADFLILEATYGDRERDDLPLSDRTARLGMEINEALAAGGNLLIPAFAVERTQELLYAIAVLLEQGTISPARVYLDSPLAIRATEVFARHCGELIDTPDAAELFAHPHFHFLQDADASRALARISGGVIIVAASGMCDAGRIRHHLKNNLWRRDATVLFTGYQAPGTLGHLILSGRRRVRIEGEEIEVNARIRRMDQYYSAHADASELVAYATNRMPIECGVFLTHGESSALAALAARLRTTLAEATPVMIPALDERADLEAPQMQLEKQSLRPLAADLTDADWHNDFAEFSLALRQRLRELRSDGERRHLLAALQRLLVRSE
ncbi:MAG: MBL fold metallo-hydrolase, partial [Pseudomonadota bacterium]|nr:MBL fold metallo-hydrolase [Pseudomonadota bacterium]